MQTHQLANLLPLLPACFPTLCLLSSLMTFFSTEEAYLYICVLSHFSCVRLFVTLWTVACQAPLSMGFSRPEYWNRLPFPSPGDLPDPGIEPASHSSPALAGGFFTTSATWEAHLYKCAVCVQLLESCLTLCNQCTTVHQAPLSMGFSRQEY